MMEKEEVSCWNCVFFAISWDPTYRYECKKMAFKSNFLPSQQVKVIDNRDCLAFESKKSNKEKKTRDRQ
jgi:hypothetical protein